MKKSFFLIFILLICLGCLSARIQEKSAWLGFHGSNINLLGDEGNQSKFWGGAQVGYYFSKTVGWEITAGYGWTRPKEDAGSSRYITYYKPISTNLKFHFLKDKKFVPYALIGAELLYWDLRDVTGDDSDFSFTEKLGTSLHGEEKTLVAVGGLGMNYFLSDVVSLEAGARFHYLTDTDVDLNGFGGDQSGILEARLGINLHLVNSKDSDGDGIKDKYDLAKNEPEDFDGFEDDDGAPDPDNDGDDILDADDGDPNLPEDLDGYKDQDGIPDPDNDGDGIPDVNDKSPNVAEDFDGFQDEDGAPDLDNDGDGILDQMDKCPNEPETKNGYMDDDGCPDVKPAEITRKPEETFEKPVVFEGVTFRSGSPYLHLDAKAVLDNIADMLKKNPGIRLEINGYTDNQGSRKVNLELSLYRAIAVKKYLVSKGIKANRLEVNGRGPDNPVASNATEEGRRQNRRIEFVRIK